MQGDDLQTKSDKRDQAPAVEMQLGNESDVDENQSKQRFPERISKEHIKTLELCSFRGKINLVTQPEELENAITILRKEKILGFDTETRPTFKRGVQYSVSLLQLSTPNEAFLIRLNHLGLSSDLADLLADPEIYKVGVAIRDDIRALNKLREFKAGGFIELAEVGKKLKIVTCGLRNLAAIFLGIRISKKAQLSNWEKAEYDEAQRIYAATDAWICLKMYQFLEQENCLPEKFIWQVPSERKKQRSSYPKQRFRTEKK